MKGKARLRLLRALEWPGLICTALEKWWAAAAPNITAGSFKSPSQDINRIF